MQFQESFHEFGKLGVSEFPYLFTLEKPVGLLFRNKQAWPFKEALLQLEITVVMPSGGLMLTLNIYIYIFRYIHIISFLYLYIYKYIYIYYQHIYIYTFVYTYTSSHIKGFLSYFKLFFNWWNTRIPSEKHQT